MSDPAYTRRRYFVRDQRRVGRRIYIDWTGSDVTHALREHAQEASPARWDDGVWTGGDAEWELWIDIDGSCHRKHR